MLNSGQKAHSKTTIMMLKISEICQKIADTTSTIIKPLMRHSCLTASPICTKFKIDQLHFDKKCNVICHFIKRSLLSFSKAVMTIFSYAFWPHHFLKNTKGKRFITLRKGKQIQNQHAGYEIYNTNGKLCRKSHSGQKVLWKCLHAKI